MKECKGCNITKDESEFSFRNKEKGTLQRLCKSCKKKEDKEAYLKDKRKLSIRKAQKKASNKIRKYIEDYKKKSKCEKCGDSRYYVLDFHHVRDKKFSISEASTRLISKDKINEEIKKCIILCSNCHRELHYLETLGRNSTVECHPDTMEAVVSESTVPT